MGPVGIILIIVLVIVAVGVIVKIATRNSSGDSGGIGIWERTKGIFNAGCKKTRSGHRI